MARTDYGAILSTVIQGTSNAIRHSEGTSSLIAPKDWAREINKLKVMPTKKVRGSICSFNDGADNSPIISLSAGVSGSGCNVCNVTENASYFQGLTKGTYGFVDLGTLNWSVAVNDSTQQSYNSDNLIGSIVAPQSTVLPNVLCPIYVAQTRDIQANNPTANYNTIGVTNTGKLRVLVRPNSYSNVDNFKTALSGVYLIYELATPTTPTITPTQYNTLLTAFGYSGYMTPITFPSSVTSGSITINADGTIDLTSGGTTTRLESTVDIRTYYGANNIWVDTGDISNLEYYADSELLYIGQMIEETATGDIASFSDGANNIPCPSVLCSINPVQDLHGQDNPYPNGGSKNELPMSISDMKSFNTTGTWNGNAYTLNGVTFSVLTDTANNITGIKVNGTATAEANFDISIYSLKAGTSKKINGTSTTPPDTTIAYGFRGYGYVSANQDRTMTRDASAGDWNNDVYIKVYQGYNAQNLMYYPMIRDASISDGTFAPYSNICPITGHTELNLVHTGANLWYEEYPDIDSTLRYVELSVPNGNYTLSTNMPLYNTFANVFLSKEIKAVTTGNDGAWNGSSRTVNTDTGKLYVYYREQGVDPRNYDVMLNVGSTATAYEPYTASTTTTDLGTTVYGGTLDVVSGVLTIDRAIVDLSTLYWSTPTNRANTSDLRGIIKAPASAALKSGAIAEKYYEVPATTSLSVEGQFAVGTDGTMYFYRNVDTPTGNLVYPLATPTTTQLTPQEVKSLLGSNNIYHDCNGQVAVTYKANGQLYVEQHT